MHVLNKKYLWKRGVAALAAALMLVQTPLGHMTTYAAVSAGTVSENDIVSGNSVQTADLELNYAYIEHAQLERAQRQNILISAGEGDVAWESASLSLVHEETGEKLQLPVSDFMDDVLQFSFDATGMQAGVYRVDEFAYSYKEDGVKFEGVISFAKIEGMEQVCFALDAKHPLAQTEFTQYDAEGNVAGASAQSIDELVDVNIVSLTGTKENLEASRPIAHAIDQAVAQSSGKEAVSADRGDKTSQTDEAINERKVAGSLVVMLDPGHDATHVGARANGLEEEDLTLKVAEYCKGYLEKNYSDVVVYMSRPSAACPYPGTSSGDCNANRVDDAYRKKADVYVSLHFNSTVGSTTTATGAIVFYPNSNFDNQAGSEGATLASKIIEQLEKLGLKNNGIQIRNSENNTTYPDGSLADYYGVIRRSKEYGIPAVIVEHAFLNNAQDAAFLKVEDNLEKLGIADALGIAQAYGLSTEEVEFDAEDLQVTDIDGGNGTFRIMLKGARPVKRIANIQFKVYPTANKKKEYMYTAELVDSATGTYAVTGNVEQHGRLEGQYKVIAYAFDAAGKKTQLRSTNFTIEKGVADTEGMQVTSALNAKEKVATVKLKGAPQTKGVYFMVYSAKRGVKSAKRYEATLLKNGQWRSKVNISEHKRSGDYMVKAYVEGYFGEAYEAAEGSFVVEGPTVRKVQMTKLNLDKGTFRVVVRGVDSKSGVKNVSIKVKTMDGTKISKQYVAKKAKSGYYYADVDMKSFKYQYGTYRLSVKVKDGNEINETVISTDAQIAQPTPLLTAKLKNKHKKLVLTAADLGIGVNVKGVRFKVIPVEKRKAAKTYTVSDAKNGTYIKTISVEDFGVSGNYKILTYVKGADGKYRKIGKTQIITVPDVEGGSVKAKRKSDNASYLTVSGIEYKGEIKNVQMRAWPVTNKKAKYVYKASKRSNGSYRAVVDSKNHKGIGGEYKYQVIVTTANGIQKTLLSGKVTLGESTPDTEGLYTISGISDVTVAQMMAYYEKNATYPTFYAVTDAPTLKKFCKIYYEECEAEGIRVEVAFAQAMHETNFLRYGGDVNIAQFNFAGIGATGGGVSGNSFETVRIGVRAHVQHLKAYANSEALSQACVDPRFQYVTRGTAPYVEWLAIPDNPYGKGWATDINYTTSMKRHIEALKNS